MNKIGVFICNYNGKDYVLNCLETVFKQSYKQVDAYVVDNASTDGSVEAILEQYEDRVEVIVNETNLGGAGGFNRALNTGLDKGYQYIVLLDNDILLDNKAFENMFNYLEAHQDVGIVGAKVMVMDMPDTVQDFGSRLDFVHFCERNYYYRVKDDGSLPDTMDCDYVPTCAVMINAEIMRKSGTMPADNFIYYDDIELSWKMKRLGYKVIALGNAVVWHKGGFRKEIINTFTQYYFLRNRLHFFAKYIDESEIEQFADYTVSDIFARLFGFKHKRKYENYRTMLYAFDDFLHLIRGKAAEYKILQLVERDTPFEQAITNKNRIKIILSDNFNPNDELEMFHILNFIIANICHKELKQKIYVCLEECSFTQEEFKTNFSKVLAMSKHNFEFPEIEIVRSEEKFDIVLKICDHVKLLKEMNREYIYVDRFCNCISNEKEYNYYTGYEEEKKLFFEIYKPMMLEAIQSIRKEA